MAEKKRDGGGLKRHMVGFETEFFILEESGAVSARADELIDAANAQKLKFPVHGEYTHNAIEISSIPNVEVRKQAHVWLETMEKIIGIAGKMGLRIYPYGTYPGVHVPTPRSDRYYRMSEMVVGTDKFRNQAGHVCGFHFHYCLPYGTFNRKTSSLRQLFRSKHKETLLSLYNVLIAADPVVTNFMESSPFLDGRHVAKDTRLFIYRAMKMKKGDGQLSGLYSEMPIFGRLPRYASALSDLIMLSEQRHGTWRELVEEKCPEYLDIVAEKHQLQFNWGPLRINRAGTFEYRGTDMNLPSHMIGTSLLLKYVLRKVKDENLTVKPSDIGIRQPFRVEGDTVYVPPYAYLSEVLQYKSALEGLSSNEVFRYSKSMFNFAMAAVPSKKDPGLARIKSVLASRKTRADMMLEDALKAGQDLSGELEDDFARWLALRACDDFEEEVRRIGDRELAIDFEE